MKLGVVLRYWPTLSETFIAREMAEILGRGIDLHVVSLGARADAALADPHPAPVLRAPHGIERLWALPALRHLGQGEVRSATTLARRTLPARSVWTALWVADQGAKLEWQRVHAHFAGEAAEVAAVVGTVLGIPWSVTTHAVDLFVPRPSVPRLLREARPCFTVCEHHRQWIADRHGVEATVVRCGVPLDVPRADPGAAGARFVCVARDVPKKGLPLLVDALDQVGGATLRLISDALVLHPRIEAGPLRPSQVAAALARAHAFVLPCRIAPNGDRDGIPVAILEAMAAGLPILTSRVSGIPEVVDDEVGWLIPPDDGRALVRALRAAAADPVEREQRGTAARARIVSQGWTVRAQVDGLLAGWERG